MGVLCWQERQVTLVLIQAPAPDTIRSFLTTQTHSKTKFVVKELEEHGEWQLVGQKTMRKIMSDSTQSTKAVQKEEWLFTDHLSAIGIPRIDRRRRLQSYRES